MDGQTTERVNVNLPSASSNTLFLFFVLSSNRPFSFVSFCLSSKNQFKTHSFPTLFWFHIPPFHFNSTQPKAFMWDLFLDKTRECQNRSTPPSLKLRSLSLHRSTKGMLLLTEWIMSPGFEMGKDLIRSLVLSILCRCMSDKGSKVNGEIER